MHARSVSYSVSNWELAFRVGEGGFAAFNVMCNAALAGHGQRSRALRDTCREAGNTPQAVVNLPNGYAPVVEFGGRIMASKQTASMTGLIHISTASAVEPEINRSAAMALPAELPLRQQVASQKRNGQLDSNRRTAPVSARWPVVAAGSARIQTLSAAVAQVPATQIPATQIKVASAGEAAAQVANSARPWTTTIVDAVNRQGATAQGVQQSMIATILGLALVTSLLSGIGWFATQQILGVRARKTDPYQVILRREVTDLARPDAQMCGELCRTGQALIGEIQVRVEDIQGAAPLRRVLLREVRSMGQFLATTVQNAPEDPREWRRMRLRLQRVVTDLIRLKDITDGAHRSLTSKIIADELPRDKQEAYEVLGANPEASEKILKRLVDALRATWHPDLAANEDDRMVRDRRIKQINVAWDLISEKRAEA